MDYKGNSISKSKLAGFSQTGRSSEKTKADFSLTVVGRNAGWRIRSSRRAIAVFEAPNTRTERRKKTRTSGSGLIHQRRRVEETCGGCRTTATNENDYMRRPCATQDYLHCETRFHNAKSRIARHERHKLFYNQSHTTHLPTLLRQKSRVKPLTTLGKSRIAKPCRSATRKPRSSISPR